MVSEGSIEKMKMLETKIYTNFSEFVEDLNCANFCIEKILPVKEFNQRTFPSDSKYSRIEVEGKKYLVKLSYCLTKTVYIAYPVYKDREPEPPRH